MSDSQRHPNYPGFGKLFLIWTAVGVLTSLRYRFLRPPGIEVNELAFTAAFTACYYPWVALTPVVFRLEQRFPLGSRNWLRNAALLALLSVPICFLASPLTAAIFALILSGLGATWARPARFSFFAHFPMSETAFWCSVAGGYFIRTVFQLREQEQKAARLALEKSQLEAGLKQAQLDALRARLNPHFLFNSLQNISVMTKQDPQTASRMLARLGDLLRAVLRNDSEPETTLDEEINLTRAYVALEQMRFGDRLAVHFHIAPDTGLAMVPSFLLQPLIENAVTHGLRGVGKAGVITVSALREGGELALTVTDNGIGPPGQDLDTLKIGVGLGSTRERLAAMYPERHSLTMRRPEQGGAEVRVVIPLRLTDHGGETFPDEHAAVVDR